MPFPAPQSVPRFSASYFPSRDAAVRIFCAARAPSTFASAPLQTVFSCRSVHDIQLYINYPRFQRVQPVEAALRACILFASKLYFFVFLFVWSWFFLSLFCFFFSLFLSALLILNRRFGILELSQRNAGFQTVLLNRFAEIQITRTCAKYIQGVFVLCGQKKCLV